MIYGVPKITEPALDIKIGTNHASAIFYIESSLASGNLGNGRDQLETAYILTLIDENGQPCSMGRNGRLRNDPLPTTSLDPRWKPGNRLREFVQRINRPGYSTWRLYARFFADSSCSYGIYRDELSIIVLDNGGGRHVKKVGIQAVLNEKSVIDRLKGDEYRPDLAENVKSENQIQFIFDSNELRLQLIKIGDNQDQVGFFPVAIHIPQEIVPCTILIESDNARNYFADRYHHLKKTAYYLSDESVQINNLTPNVWEDGVRLRTFLQRISKAGEYHWKLWVKIQDKAKSPFTNTINFIVIDSKGKRHSQGIYVKFE